MHTFKKLNDSNLEVFQKSFEHFMICHKFRCIGSFVVGYNDDIEFASTMVNAIDSARGDVQVVYVMGDNCLKVYGEYAPYYVCNCDNADVVNICRTGEFPGEEVNLGFN